MNTKRKYPKRLKLDLAEQLRDRHGKFIEAEKIGSPRTLSANANYLKQIVDNCPEEADAFLEGRVQEEHAIPGGYLQVWNKTVQYYRITEVQPKISLR